MTEGFKDLGSVAVSPIAQPKGTAVEEEERSLFGEAVKENWIISGSDDWERLTSSFEDTGYRMSEEELKTLEGRFDIDQLNKIMDASSEDERDALFEEFDESNERRAWLNDQGLEGTVAEIGAILSDPTLWAATATAELGGIALVGAKASRIARLTRALGAAGVSEAAMGAIRSETENDYTEKDMAFDMLAALTITGGLELALGKNASVLVKEYEDSVVRQAKGALDAGAKERVMEVESWRIDDYARRINSGNSEAASFAEAHLQDAINGGSTSSAVRAERIRSNAMAKSNKAFAELWDSYKKSNNLSGANWVEKARHMNELGEKVWDAKVMGVDHGPEVQKVVSTLDGIYNDVLGQAEDSGLAGFTREMANPSYMKQEWDRVAWQSLHKEMGRDEFAELINKGLYGFDEDDILKRIDELEVQLKGVTDEGAEALQKELDELIGVRTARAKLATGFTKRMLDRADGEATHIDELLEDEAGLVAWLKETDNVPEEEIKDYVQKALRTKQRSADVVDRGKKRIQIDPKASIMTKAGKEVRVADLMNRNALELNQSYIHSMSGHIAMAHNGIKKPSDWKALLDNVRSVELKNRSGQRDAARHADELVEKIEQDRREIMGMARYDTSVSTGNRLTNLLLKHNFMTAMGKAAFSALSEMGRILGENGVRNTLRSLTSLDGLFTDALRTVNKNSHIIKEVNEFNASIGDEYLVRLFNSFDETGVMEGKMTDGLLSKAELIAHRGTQLMAKASLLAPVDKGLRMLSFSSSTNSLYRHLVLGKGSRLPFKQMGLTQPVLDDIARNMRAHTSISSTGHVQKLGIEKWDRATADAFMDAMTTNGARQVQKALAGESIAITQHPVGRVFFQFRKFAIDAYSKHLRADLKDIRSEPLRVLLSTTYGTMFAALGYYGRTMSAAASMEEGKREDYLKERFATERVVANAVQYTPNLGTFVTAWNLTGGSSIDGLEIPVTRTTGLSNRIDAGQNASVDKVNKMLALLADLNTKDPEKFFKQAKPLIPFQNTIPGDLVSNTVERAMD